MLHPIIDIGSNTMRLAIYRVEKNHAALLCKKKQTIGLAAYVKNGVMTAEGIEKAAAALTEFHRFLDALSLPLTAAFATAALRNAKNRDEAVAALKARAGIAIRILSGAEEAELGFLGVTAGLSAPSGLMADIGGGSTELVRYEDRVLTGKISLPIGSLQLAAQNVRGLFPTPQEAARIEEEVTAALSALETPRPDAKAPDESAPFVGTFPLLCGIGGTFKGAKNLYFALSGAQTPGEEMPAAALSDIIHRFSPEKALPEDDLALFLTTEPDRLHTLIPGLILARGIAARFGVATLHYSDAGVREGFLYRECMAAHR